jgi:hypothetical protein
LPLPGIPVSGSGASSVPLGGRSEILYRSELAVFRMFDLEPGLGTVELAEHSSNPTDPTTDLVSFISSFLPSLLPITPTLSLLASLTFRGLTEHASTLSTVLLRVFIDQPGKLNLCAHLVLLQDLLLVSRPEFKSKLIVALFDDAGEFGGGECKQRGVRFADWSGSRSEPFLVHYS